jgi:hypothetical protein
MGFTAPYDSHHYVGEHADDATANAFVTTTLGWTLSAGQIYYDTTLVALKLRTASAWVVLSTGGGPGASISVLQFGADGLVSSPGTRYLTPGFANISASILELAVTRAGTLQNLFTTHSTPGGPGAQPVTYTVLVNGAPTALTTTLLADVAGPASDLVNTVAVAQGDRIAIQVVNLVNLGGGGAGAQPAVTLELA